MRRKRAWFYNKQLKDANIAAPFEANNAKHVYHLYILQSDNRSKTINYLKENGIATGVYYPIPLFTELTDEEKII